MAAAPLPNPIALLESRATTLTLRGFHQLHAQLLVAGVLDDPPSLGKLIAALALSPHFLLPYSHRVLAHSRHPPTVFALNSLIRAHSKGPDPHRSFHLYRFLLRRSLAPDHYTFTFLVRASAHPSHIRAAHAAALRRGLAGGPHFLTALVHAYASLVLPADAQLAYSELRRPDHVAQTAMLGALAAAGDLAPARRLFDEMPHRDPVAWNAMIAGYSHSRRPREALELFSSMLAEGARVTEATMVPVLSACTLLGSLEQGKWAHTYINKHRVQMTVTLGTALVDMYAKCGDVKRAMEVFWSMGEKNVYTWSSAIGGLAMNGAGKECLELFELMKGEGALPNEVTFTSALHGCSVGGLVDEGRKLFASIRGQYGLEPTLENYGCMVDLYARAGRLDDAIDFINAMPVEPHTEAWGALLNGCRIHRNTKLGEYAARKIVELESKNHGAYVLLSNIYADSRNWKGVRSVRELMQANKVKKELGCSSIDVVGGL